MSERSQWLEKNRCPWCKNRRRKRCDVKMTKTIDGWRCWGYRCDEERRWTA